MIGKRDLAANVLGHVGALHAICALRTKFSNGVPILAYHRVLDIPDENLFPFDVELVSASVAAFTCQMRYVKENYVPISFTTLLQYVDRGETPPPGSIIVTFDDGFSDNYYNAFPVLKKFDIPATVFLSTGYIDDQEIFWYEKLSYAVMTTKARSVAIPDLAVLKIDETALSRRNTIKTLLNRLKRVPNQVRQTLLDDLFNQLLPNQRGITDARSGPMTWEQIQEMSAYRIEFGSHSVSHPILSMLDSETLKYELEHSKLRIEAMLKKPVQILAYPVGGAEAFNDNVRLAARSAGYRLGVSYISGVEKPGQWDDYALRRLHVERYVSSNYFKAMLSIPELFS